MIAIDAIKLGLAETYRRLDTAIAGLEEIHDRAMKSDYAATLKIVVLADDDINRAVIVEIWETAPDCRRLCVVELDDRGVEDLSRRLVAIMVRRTLRARS